MRARAASARAPRAPKKIHQPSTAIILKGYSVTFKLF
jgi:hypothetical protein